MCVCVCACVYCSRAAFVYFVLERARRRRGRSGQSRWSCATRAHSQQRAKQSKRQPAPAEARLRALERQQLEEQAVVADDGAPPLLVVVSGSVIGLDWIGFGLDWIGLGSGLGGRGSRLWLRVAACGVVVPIASPSSSPSPSATKPARRARSLTSRRPPSWRRRTPPPTGTFVLGARHLYMRGNSAESTVVRMDGGGGVSAWRKEVVSLCARAAASPSAVRRCVSNPPLACSSSYKHTPGLAVGPDHDGRRLCSGRRRRWRRALQRAAAAAAALALAAAVAVAAAAPAAAAPTGSQRRAGCFCARGQHPAASPAATAGGQEALGCENNAAVVSNADREITETNWGSICCALLLESARMSS